MLILFRENKEYENIVFKKDCVYDLKNENGFPQRWLKRGCLEVSKKDAKKVFPDPRVSIKRVVKTGKKGNNKPSKA